MGRLFLDMTMYLDLEALNYYQSKHRDCSYCLADGNSQQMCKLNDTHVIMARLIKFWLLVVLVCFRIASDSTVSGERRIVLKDYYMAFSMLIASV